jgi:hypothetical protein
MRLIDLDLATDRYRELPTEAPLEGERVEGEVVDMDGEPVAMPEPRREEITHPVTINADDVSYFHPRKGDRVGTRVVMRNGQVVAVTMLHDEFRRAILGVR